MPEHVCCNLCGSEDAQQLYRLRDHRFRVDDTLWTVVRCRPCGLGYLNPRPTREELGQYYPEQYFAPRSANSARVRYEREAAYVPRGTGDLLDVGTANGDFLRVMRQRGWCVTGIEPAETAVAPPDIPVVRSRFPEEASFPPESFDVITAWAVFEHLHDPARAFVECARLLKPGGSLILQVPNLNSVFGRFSRQEDVPRHLYFFTPKTLRGYGKHAGLELDSITHTTDLYGGAGRGVLRLALARACGKSTDEFFELISASRRERFRRAPLLALPWLAAAGLEHLVLSDAATRALRVSGQIVASFRAPGTSWLSPAPARVEQDHYRRIAANLEKR